MTDPLDRLRQPVEPLAPPAGTFDALLARAHRRRVARTSLVAALTAVVLSVGGGFIVNAGRPASTGRLVTPVAPRHTPSPSATPAPAGTTPAPGTTPLARQLVPPTPFPAGRGPVPRGFRPYSVTSVSGGVTFLLGDAPCSTVPCTSVVRSTDGGRSWTGLPAPRAPLPRWQAGRVSPGSTVRDLRFASIRDGWAFGGALYATHDGARTWRPVDVGGSVLDLATDGSTTYAVVATCNAQGFTCEHARLRSTPTSADRWRDVAGVAGGNGGQISLSGRGGILLLTGGSGRNSLFVRTGSGWQPAAPPPCPTSVSAVSASAASARLFTFCGEGAAGSVYLTTYVSDLAGKAWQRQPGPALQVPNGEVSAAGATAEVVLVAAGSPDRGGRLARSADGGRSWADAAVPQLANGWRYVGASSASSLVGLPAQPDGSVWTSDDAGLHWAAYRFR